MKRMLRMIKFSMVIVIHATNLATRLLRVDLISRVEMICNMVLHVKIVINKDTLLEVVGKRM